ncbi:MAG: hypothetical protein HC878_10100, partial [Leptolyngbyaceae cyanobacterium SL_5_14]|nr:hypothetical protein [Leptolyngbyaceae cyanobacterium SL_5_14]
MTSISQPSKVARHYCKHGVIERFCLRDELLLFLTYEEWWKVEKVRLCFVSGAIALELVTTGAPALAEISLNAEDPHSAEIAEVARTTSLQVTPDVEQVAT